MNGETTEVIAGQPARSSVLLRPKVSYHYKPHGCKSRLNYLSLQRDPEGACRMTRRHWEQVSGEVMLEAERGQVIT